MRCFKAVLLVLFLVSVAAHAGETRRIEIPAHLAGAHPRIALRARNSQTEVRALVASDPSAHAAVEKARVELAPYIEYVRQDPMWMASRLQMYWKSHAIDVYNRGDVFDHAEGHAPVATVRYPGSRDPVSVYRAPKLEDIPPYEDDTRGVWLVNTAIPGQPMEWASPSKAGRVVDGINSNILRMAGEAARLGWVTGDEQYAQFAFTIFDTYMRGMYYRNEPIDLNHGHSQTIYGMSTFEVIQEGVLPELASTYDFLYSYIKRNHPDALPIYADAFRKWIDVTVHNGVPFNNWDLIEARFILAVALILDDDAAYSDHRGAEYYLNLVLNEDSVRQWSLRKLAASGFDSETGIWFEAPGYSMNVVNDFITFINQVDREAGTDLLESIPVIRKAVEAMAQYAFPNGVTVSWGDSHYGAISTAAMREMVANARLHRRRDDEVYFTGLAKFFEHLNGQQSGRGAGGDEKSIRVHGLESLFDRDSFDLDPSIPALRQADVLTATFSAPSVSYVVQRNGLDPSNGLMIAEAGSLGNHQHANGITMELYGQGLPLAPDSGIGTNYFQADHNEYYAQFPAHNTVVVDGVSSYPTMLSHHGFTVNALYPPAGDRNWPKVRFTFSDVSFLEPETNSDQRRVMGTVRLSNEDGYYIDIFRSHRRDGRDKLHDYFFHGMGQELEIEAGDGTALPKTPTDKLTFAEASLGAYDYLWNKQAIAAAETYCAIYRLQLPSKSEIQLHAWIAGGKDRQLYSVLAPPARSLRDTVPVSVGNLPLHTLVLRQAGEAWNRPFVSVFEPSRADRPASIDAVHVIPLSSPAASAVAVRVDEGAGRHQVILSAVESREMHTAEGASLQGRFGVIDAGPNKESLFLGEGNWIASGDLRMELIGEQGSAFVERAGAHLSISATCAAKLTVPRDGNFTLLRMEGKSIAGRQMRKDGKEVIVFAIPASTLTDAELVRP
ncbi:MAG: heparinase II/III family protein [Terracidiphilus sp.]|nr:heparinase II/III family protein [Terracidiphilus sp.]